MGTPNFDFHAEVRQELPIRRYDMNRISLIVALTAVLPFSAWGTDTETDVSPRDNVERQLGFVRSKTPMICQLQAQGKGTFSWSKPQVYVRPSTPAPALGESLWVYFDYSDSIHRDGTAITALQLGDSMRFELTGFSSYD